MEVKIGVTHTARELAVDVDLEPAAVEDLVRQALTDGGVLSLSDARGRRVVVPVDRLGYVDITATPTGTVGFRS